MIDLNSHGEWETTFTSILSWLAAHGFELNSREWANLAWLAIIAVGMLWHSDIRSSVVSVLKTMASRQLVPVWFTYIVWIVSFVLIADWIGIWRSGLTKDTFVWSTTAGFGLLLQVTKAGVPGYFRRAIRRILSVTVAVEYVLNLATFSFLVEFALLQPLLFLAIVVPIVGRQTDEAETLRKIGHGVLAILLAIVVVHTARTLYMIWPTLDWEMVFLEVVWPVLLGVWVIVLLFPLALVFSYQEAFVQLGLQRNKDTGLWKAELGLVLALTFRLRLIRKVTKNAPHDVAQAESVCAAYNAAKSYKGRVS